LLANVFAPYGISEAMIPDPFNIFPQSTPISASATLAPLSRAGDHIELQAELDCLVALPACPQDQNACDGYQISDVWVQFPG
jgi:uncharacterized protein YcgI (DUF1989 family)